MFLSKRNGIWYIWFTDETGHRKKISARTSVKSDAIRFLRSFDEKLVGQRNPRFSIEAYSNELLTNVHGTLSEGTYDLYKSAFAHLLQYTGDQPLDKLTPYHWDKYKIERGRAVSPVTVNIELRCLRAGLNTAVRWRFIRSNPFAGLRLLQVPQRQPTYFNEDEFELVIRKIREKWLRDLVFLAGATGMRQGELLSLKWDQIDFHRRMLSIQSSIGFRTKAGRRRTIPLNAGAFALLTDLRETSDSAFVFTLNGKPLKRRWVGEKLRRYIRGLGLDRKLNFHSLRHSFASWLAIKGVSIYQISLLLGHSSVGVTQDFYAHLQPDQLREVVEKLTLPNAFEP